jgi:Asp-tRNA(Asn)/Glu-tRNA(Gln) amidotransferase A subunit family amidase
MGLPVGLQITGRPYDELNLLKFAAWVENILIEEMACEKNDLICSI